MDKKCAVIEISDKFLEQLLKGTMGKGGLRYFKVIERALPLDTSVIRVFLPYHACDVLGVVVASETFPLTKEGDPYPKLELPIVETIRESEALKSYERLSKFVQEHKLREKFGDKTVTDIMLELAELGRMVAKSPS